IAAVFVVNFGTYVAVAQTAGSAKVTGVVRSATGSAIAGAVVMLNVLPGPNAKPFDANTVTAADGSFTFTQVPAGNFAICPQAPNSNFLAPCVWDPTPPKITVATGNVQVPPIVMKNGVMLRVRVDDPSGI